MAGVDAEEMRRERDERWSKAAAGWGRRADAVAQAVQAVTLWMVEAIRPRPGMTVVELACGPAEPGLLAAEMVAPDGRVLLADAVEEMVEIARRRADERGIHNVEARVVDLEWLDFGAATADAILCRWGYMFAIDPEAAFAQARRTLRPGGRIALAVWEAPEANPFASVPARALVELGHAEPPPPGAPGMFALSGTEAVPSLLRGAGFGEIECEPVDITYRYESLDDFWAWTCDLARPFAETVARISPDEREAVRERIGEGLSPYEAPDGSLAVPGRAVLAAATA